LSFSACQQNSQPEEVQPEEEISNSTPEETAPEDQDYLLEPGALMGIHFGIQNEDVTTQETRNFLRYALFPQVKDQFPGSRSFYLRPDRGPRLGTEVLLWVFQDQPSRDQYFPAQDFPTQKFEQLWQGIQHLYTDSTFFKYFQYGWQTSGFSTDYEVVAVQDVPEKEWFREDAALVIEHFQLRPDADSLAFLNFIQSDWNMHGLEAGSPKIEAILYASRGYLEGRYAKLTVFNSLADRNRDFPYIERPADEMNKADIDARLLTYLAPLEDESGHYEVLY
jgi:hypothetical protein